MDNNEGAQWTGDHTTMDNLFKLGMAIGKVVCPFPRNMWSALAGGMPYYEVNLD